MQFFIKYISVKKFIVIARSICLIFFIILVLFFADDTCENVSEAGATKAVMSAMTTHAHHIGIQESCCWALACFSRCGKIIFISGPGCSKHR